MPHVRRRPKQSHEKYGSLIIVTLIPLVTFVGGVVTTGYTLYDTIATKPYVEKRFEEAQTNTKALTAQILRDAMEHSDTNRREMMIAVEKAIGELRTRNAVVDTKIQTVLESVSSIREWIEDREPKSRRRHE